MPVTGTAGNDTLFGTSAADQMFGLAGDDLIFGSSGADTIDGGSGSDTVDYQVVFQPLPVTPGLILLIRAGAVDVDLERSTQAGGLAQGDVLIGIENIDGSTKDDVIKGDGANNVL